MLVKCLYEQTPSWCGPALPFLSPGRDPYLLPLDAGQLLF